MHPRTSASTSGKRAVVAIDGPNASGKGALSKRLAGHFGWPLLVTGLMYRAAGLAVAEAGVDFDDEPACVEVIRALRFTLDAPDTLLIDGVPADVRKLQSHEVGEAASRVSAYRKVRQHVHAVQREFAEQGNVIIEGRDIGTVIAPDARFKIYLTASPEVRARRRLKELAGRGVDADYETVLADVSRRDERDTKRAHSPLRPAEDAVIIDTSDMTLDEVFRSALEHLENSSG
ncbi:MAG: (d)CMP kinase [bacterium]|nr:(d)CMP kinase [bacterium]